MGNMARENRTVTTDFGSRLHPAKFLKSTTISILRGDGIQRFWQPNLLVCHPNITRLVVITTIRPLLGTRLISFKLLGRYPVYV